MDSISVSEIFYSIQGETSHAGKPAVFVRLSGCNLNCRWCDTLYARSPGKETDMEEVLVQLSRYQCREVVITGGEPLKQKSVILLLKRLCEADYKVHLETNGSLDISDVPEEVSVILDMKPPSSGESDKMLFSNLEILKDIDELKFLIADREDFLWSLELLAKTSNNCREILFSPVTGEMDFKELADWVAKDFNTGRIQPNLHKVFGLK